MTFTPSEEIRIQKIESKLNDIQTALMNFSTKQQLKSLLGLRQAEIEALKSQVASLESQVLVLQAL